MMLCCVGSCFVEHTHTHFSEHALSKVRERTSKSARVRESDAYFAVSYQRFFGCQLEQSIKVHIPYHFLNLQQTNQPILFSTVKSHRMFGVFIHEKDTRTSHSVKYAQIFIQFAKLSSSLLNVIRRLSNIEQQILVVLMIIMKRQYYRFLF